MRIQIRDLRIEYNTPGGETLPVLGPLTLDIAPGTFVTLVGPSGCGKSTLIRVLAGLQAPTHGEALLDDRPITEPPARVGLMFQDANLMPWRTVQDNIALPLELAGQTRGERYAAVYDLLPTLGLADFAQAYPGELSGGMAQRAALGRVLIQNPGLLLLDEPFGALDALTREEISFDLLRMWSRERPTVLMVTHDINEAVLLADRVLVMSPRPGQIALDMAVGMPRPRHLDYIYSDAFATIAQQVRAAITH
jgi:NitT/TauT family transport system ATP-binding protein